MLYKRRLLQQVVACLGVPLKSLQIWILYLGLIKFYFMLCSVTWEQVYLDIKGGDRGVSPVYFKCNFF